MDRRQFIGTLGAGLLISRSVNSFAARNNVSSGTPQTFQLWPVQPPGGGGPSGPVHWTAKGAQSNISQPSLTLYMPVKTNGYAVLIAAGGGYKRIEMASEALPAARWLTKRGFTAYVLSYRLPGEGWKDGNLVALQDAQRAIRLIRQREKNVGLLGFSAGGHLLGMAATRPDFSSYPVVDSHDSQPAAADRAALIYPIITLESPYTHTSTHKILVGNHATPQQDEAWSVQSFVTPDSPPFFLVQAKDDPISNPENTLIMKAACERSHVPVELYRYATGGHGFGMGKPGTPTMEWPSHYQYWLHNWQTT